MEKIIRCDRDGQLLLRFAVVKGFGGKAKPVKPPPAHHDVDTSQFAAQAVARKVPSRKQLALRLIEAAGERGLTNHELRDVTGWLLASTTPVTNALAEEGQIIDSGRRRPSPSNVPCKVWIVAKEGTR